MQQIYRGTPMPTCGFNKVTLQWLLLKCDLTINTDDPTATQVGELVVKKVLVKSYKKLKLIRNLNLMTTKKFSSKE